MGRKTAEVAPKLDILSGAALTTLAQPYLWGHELLGLFSTVTPGTESATRIDLGPIVEVSLAARRRARERGDYAESDRIRDELAALGVQVEDHGGSATWRLREVGAD